MFFKDAHSLKWVGLLTLPILYFIPFIHTYIDSLVIIMLTADFERLKIFILSFGIWAPAISIGLMMLQAIIAPLPALVLVLVNAWAFGWFWGAFYSWLGGLLGAALCFYIARWYGRPAVEKLFGAQKVARVDNFFRRYGKYAVFIARLTPVLSFDLISYAAGLTAISTGAFLWATALGQLPAVILYSILGNNLSNGVFHILWAIPIVLLLIMLGFGARHWFRRENVSNK
jgi:uncharacterized membrane protein YdjX (TVP38/TMEM64 family)